MTTPSRSRALALEWSMRINDIGYIFLAFALFAGTAFSQDIFGTGADGDLVVDDGVTFYADQITANVVGNNSSGQNIIGVINSSDF